MDEHLGDIINQPLESLAETSQSSAEATPIAYQRGTVWCFLSHSCLALLFFLYFKTFVIAVNLLHKMC